MLAELVAEAVRRAPTPGLHDTAVPALRIIRSDAIYERVHSMHQPSLCFIAQGTKVVTVGDEVLRYGAGQFLYSSVELPITGEVVEATRRQPYLVLVLEVEPTLVFDLVTASRHALRGKDGGARRGIFVDHDDAMTEAFYRLLRCLRDPVEAHVLAPSVVREIVFRLMRGRYGDAVREIGLADSQTRRIASVIEHLKGEYTKPQSVGALAQLAGMSTSAFYAHFRKVTTLTPLQYQKHLRLQEARRLLLTLATSAADAAFRVGYESASQFSREYARHFGLPPLSDVKRAARQQAEGAARSPSRRSR
jgi:AraC-like DNA-binding protein